MADGLPTRHLAVLLLGLAFLFEPYAVASAAADTPMTKFCSNKLKSWQRRANHKAFALSQLIKTKKDYKQVCGLAWEADSKRYAITVALKECRQAAARSKLRNPRCQVIASR